MPSEVTLCEPEHVYRDETGRAIDSVSAILRGAKVRPAPYIGGGGQRGDAMRRGLKRGVEVHRITRAIDEEFDEYAALDDVFDPADLNPENVNYVSAYQRFLELSGYEPIAWEKVLYHPVYDYAGRADMIGWLGTQRILADRKTDRSLHRAVWLQLSAYREAWNAMFPTQPIDRTYALVLKADTEFELKPNPLEPGDFPYFLGAIWMHRWNKLVM